MLLEQLDQSIDQDLKNIALKVQNEQQLSVDEGIKLFDADLSYLGILANYIRENKHGNYTYFNRNIHVEPTNICVFDCKFCAYSTLKTKLRVGN